ncbi:MAG: hypothetical protein B6I22_09365 [Desulfobacteraceae bacterium 4572_123]|nr:MAG: hypothetical protein B6I22_09365 [Desulfobacteraceae bacterium 4572_123]
MMIARNWKYSSGHVSIFKIAFVAMLVVLSVAPQSGYAQEQMSIAGLTEPVNDVLLSFETDGKLAKIYFKEGGRVKKGDTIMALNKWFEELEVQRNKLIWQGKAEIKSAMEREKTLKALFESTRELYEKTKSVSKDELEKLELEYKLAAAEHERLEIAEKREHIEYDMARAKLAKLVLRSPVTGIISELAVDEGESCESRQPVVRVVDTSRCRLVCNIEASLGIKFKEKQKVDLEIQAGSGSIQKTGKIIFISPVVDPASGLYRVKAEFENKNHEIKPGVEGFLLIPAP